MSRGDTEQGTNFCLKLLNTVSRMWCDALDEQVTVQASQMHSYTSVCNPSRYSLYRSWANLPPDVTLFLGNVFQPRQFFKHNIILMDLDYQPYLCMNFS